MAPPSGKIWSRYRENAVAVAAIVGTVAAIAAGLIAYLQLSDQTSTQKKGELQGQAESVSAAVLGEDPSRFAREPYVAGTRIGLYNKSDAPVRHVIVTLVVNNRSARGYDSELQREDQRYLLVLPPGKSVVEVSAGWHGMSAQPGAEIAFVDQAGRGWVRPSGGTLLKIASPVAYYGLSEPLGWGEAAPAHSG
jgi:hypothetical protein